MQYVSQNVCLCSPPKLRSVLDAEGEKEIKLGKSEEHETGNDNYNDNDHHHHHHPWNLPACKWNILHGHIFEFKLFFVKFCFK